MRVLALIPARGGSKGIPRKNITPLGGKPLIAWTIEAARAASAITRVVVSTDDAEISDVARAHGAEVPFLRPGDISDDAAPALPVIRHALHALQTLDGWTADAIAYLQPTSPFRDGQHIDDAVALLAASGADTVVSVVRVPHNMVPTSLMEMRDGRLEFCASPEQRQFSRQAKELLFARNGPAILLNRRATIDGAGLYGDRIAPLEMAPLVSVDIDEPGDLQIAQALLPLVLARREKQTG